MISSSSTESRHLSEIDFIRGLVHQNNETTDIDADTRNATHVPVPVGGNDPTMILVWEILMFGVTPSIAVLGVCGNVISIVILKKHGLDKSSNILLVTLAIADIGFLVGYGLNIPKLLADSQGQGRAFLFSKVESQALYCIYSIFFILDYGMASISLTIPAFITVERLVAVYLPLKMASLVTPTRTWLVVGVFSAYCLGISTYTCFWHYIDYAYDPEFNRTVGLIRKTHLFTAHANFRTYFRLFHIGAKIQPVFTFFGCILIIVKVKMSDIKRSQMTSASSNGGRKSPVFSKTTVTLLSVCIVYLVVCAVVAMPAFLPPNVVQYRLTSQSKNTLLNMIMNQILNLALCLNGSWNFIIYIAFNKKFRDTFHEIKAQCFPRCCMLKQTLKHNENHHHQRPSHPRF